jgi:myosin heavy subunit
MNQDLTQQWLTEIQALKQQLAELRQERDDAWESAQKWRKLYNTESEQRRSDSQLSQQAIASLKLQIQQMRGIEEGLLNETTTDEVIQREIANLNSLEEWQGKLIATLKERDQLLQALKTEQENHAQTRKNLTTALGDAIDGLAKERAGVNIIRNS